MTDAQKDILSKDFEVTKKYVQPSIYPKGNKNI